MHAPATLPSHTEALDGLYRELGLEAEDIPGSVTIAGEDPITPSVHRFGDACAVALAAMGSVVSVLWRDRSGRAQDVSVSVPEAVCQLMASRLNYVAGVQTYLLREENLVKNTDFYRAADGRVIDICFVYPHLRDVVCEVLDCAPLHERIADAVSRWDAFELETAIATRGGTAAVVRTAVEWAAHPAGRALAQRPLLRIEKIGDGPPEPFPSLPAQGALPLSGLRVLDNGHVLAGPLAGRMMAENGAEVLHISHPAWPDSLSTHCEANIGKRAAYCNLFDPAQADRFHQLLQDADVYISSWRSLERKGFGARDLAASRPGIVVLEVSAFGHDGPWGGRGGFDFQAAAAAGLYADEGTLERPERPPTRILNDYLSPILANAAITEALRRRARDGGSYRVHIPLARVAMWAKSFGMLSREQVAGIPMVDPVEVVGDKFVTVDGPYGPTRYLPTRINYSDIRPGLRRGAEPLGASLLEWSR